MGLKFTNCVRKALPRSGILAEGFVGVDASGDLHFKPSRGSGGFALYDKEKICKANTGCSEAVRIALIAIKVYDEENTPGCSDPIGLHSMVEGNRE